MNPSAPNPAGPASQGEPGHVSIQPAGLPRAESDRFVAPIGQPGQPFASQIPRPNAAPSPQPQSQPPLMPYAPSPLQQAVPAAAAQPQPVMAPPSPVGGT